MKDGSRISKILSKMEFGELEQNLELLEYAFDDLSAVSNRTGRNLVQELVSRKYDEKQVFLAIRTLFKKVKLDPNHVDKNGLNFIQTAINTGYSQQFICECIKLTVPLGLEVNHKDADGNTIIHSAILATNYRDSIADMLMLLTANGYDIEAKNEDKKDVCQLAMESTKYKKIKKMEIISSLYEEVSRPKNLVVRKTTKSKR